jgi:hypothetical protein
MICNIVKNDHTASRKSDPEITPDTLPGQAAWALQSKNQNYY